MTIVMSTKIFSRERFLQFMLDTLLPKFCTNKRYINCKPITSKALDIFEYVTSSLPITVEISTANCINYHILRNIYS